MTNWKTYRWGNIATLEYGKSLRDYRTSNGNVPVFGTNGQVGFTEKALCNFPSVIIGRKGAYRGVHYSAQPFFVIDTAFYLKPISGNLDLKFAYYNLILQDINGLDSGSAIPSTRREDFYELEVNLPDFPTQRRIAEILSALDDKIELNRRMNQTLEQMAQTLFRQYFVDGIDEENLPEGWRFGTVGEICTVNSKTLSKNDKLEWLDYVEISAVGKGVINSIANYKRGEEPSRARRKLIHGDTVLSTVRPDRGAYFLAVNPYENLIASTGFAVFTATEVPYSFLYLLLTQEENFKYYGFIANGAAYPAINPESILAMETVIPSEEALTDFHNKVEPILLKYNSNNQEAKTLSTLRDTLLPKLMSGEIDVMQTKPSALYEPVLS